MLIALMGLSCARAVSAADRKPQIEPRPFQAPDEIRSGADGKPRLRADVFYEKSKNPLPEGYKLLYEQDCADTSSLKDFVMTDTKAWRWSNEDNGGALELFQQSKYDPAVRSPFNIALIADKVFGDFILEADLLQTGKEYGHRDMCLFFGFQNPTNFYYVHLATAADEHAHNIFIVKDAPRIKIAKETTKGINWGSNAWHHVRLERNPGDGSIKVFFDDMSVPIMTATDRRFGPGYIGFGSFDDTGNVKNVRVWGRSMETRKTEFFARP
jgi:hypothetical protein